MRKDLLIIFFSIILISCNSRDKKENKIEDTIPVIIEKMEPDSGILEVVYPQISDENYRMQSRIHMLNEALEITKPADGPYNLRASDNVMIKNRFVVELEIGERITIIRSATDDNIEEKLLPIKVPLLKGLLGYRIFIANRNKRDQLDRVDSLEKLQQFSVIQGLGWADVVILEHNNFKVLTDPKYENLFKLVNFDMADLFSRSVVEAYIEMEQRYSKYPNLYIDESFVIHYPFYEYFFVNKNNTILADRVERGLNLIIENGTYEKIFKEFYGEILKKVKIDQRKIFELENPFYSKEIRPEYRDLLYKPVK